MKQLLLVVRADPRLSSAGLEVRRSEPGRAGTQDTSTRSGWRLPDHAPRSSRRTASTACRHGGRRAGADVSPRASHASGDWLRGARAEARDPTFRQDEARARAVPARGLRPAKRFRSPRRHVGREAPHRGRGKDRSVAGWQPSNRGPAGRRGGPDRAASSRGRSARAPSHPVAPPASTRREARARVDRERPPRGCIRQLPDMRRWLRQDVPALEAEQEVLSAGLDRLEPAAVEMLGNPGRTRTRMQRLDRDPLAHQLPQP